MNVIMCTSYKAKETNEGNLRFPLSNAAHNLRLGLNGLNAEIRVAFRENRPNAGI